MRVHKKLNKIKIKTKDASGFTFLECMVVLVLISVIAIFSLPSFNYFLEKSREKIVYRSVLHAILYARVLAMTHHKIMTLCGTLDEKNCIKDWSQGILVKSEQEILFSTLFKNKNDKLLIRFFPKNDFILNFLWTGFPEIHDGTVWFCLFNHSNPSWAIIISRAGRVRTLFPDKNGVILDAHRRALICR